MIEKFYVNRKFERGKINWEIRKLKKEFGKVGKNDIF